MKRVMFGLVILLAMTFLPGGPLTVGDAFAVTPDVQIVFSTSTNDYIIDPGTPGEVIVLGDPDDAITGNRGYDSLSGLLDLLAGLVDENGNLDLVSLQLILDLLNGL